MLRYIFIVVGTISLGLGLLGLVTPGLPTTPFILLTGFVYAKSSPRLYDKLQRNKLTGMYLRGMNEGFSLRMRLLFLSIMWFMITMSAFFIFQTTKARIILLVLGIVGTISQLVFLKKKKTVHEIVSAREGEINEDVM